jgi:recombination protein RecA
MSIAQLEKLTRREEARACDLSYVEKQVILGGTLGDGTIQYHKGRVTSAGSYGVSHAAGQFGYLEFQALLLNRLLSRVGISMVHDAVQFTVICGRQTSRQAAYSFHTVSIPQLFDLRQSCYSGEGGKKYFTREWLDQIDELGLAVWFMDDGTCTEVGNGWRAQFAINGRSAVEAEMLAGWFVDRWGLAVGCPTRDGRGSTVNICSREKLGRFFEIIAPYIPPCMQDGKTTKSKLPPEYRGRFDPTLGGWVDPQIWDEEDMSTKSTDACAAC